MPTRKTPQRCGLILVTLALLIAPPLSAQSLTSEQTAAIDAAANKALKDTGVPAASIAIVRDGRIIYEKAYGFQRKGEPARTDARYSIASVGPPS